MSAVVDASEAGGLARKVARTEPLICVNGEPSRRVQRSVPDDLREAMHGVAELVFLMLPAYFANMAPPFVRFWPGWNRPISTRWLGDHKTVVGFALGVAAGALSGYGLSLVAWSGSLVAPADWPMGG